MLRASLSSRTGRVIHQCLETIRSGQIEKIYYRIYANRAFAPNWRCRRGEIVMKDTKYPFPPCGQCKNRMKYEHCERRTLTQVVIISNGRAFVSVSAIMENWAAANKSIRLFTLLILCAMRNVHKCKLSMEHCYNLCGNL